MIRAVKLLKQTSNNFARVQKMQYNAAVAQYNFGTIKTFILPDLGEKIKEATVKEWHVNVGDVVEEFQTIADVSTDKLFTQIPSSYNGKITKLYYEEEDIALIGEAFVDIEVEDNGSVADAAPAQQQETQQQQSNNKPQENQQQQSSSSTRSSGDKVLATPATRGLAKELNIDINQVVGTGPEGRVTDNDIHNFVNQSSQQQQQGVQGRRQGTFTPAGLAESLRQGVGASEVQGTGIEGIITKQDVQNYIKSLKSQKQNVQKQQQQSTFQTRTVKMDNFAQGMQKSMTVSNTIPTLYIKEEIDITETHNFREQLKQQGHKVTFMSIFVKAFSLALKEFPVINSVYDEAKPFEYKIVDNHNITIAIASPHGLVVPNLKNVQDLSILEVQQGINDLRQKAEKGQLGAKELFEGSVSMSNIGTIGGTYASPLIFAPQTSIVAIGRSQELPRYINGDLKPRKIINVSLGCDHRVIDGANATGFLMKWKQYLENPNSMLINMK